ncbi:hypothetical protein [Limnohabitans sp. 15K]|uniref:hypothetical protein n=1 Tax=Limnohabitans sp. 15K TaxID=1100706 RepID=UPI001E533061|nr:hypothetical protein [Limnohabitans sp. 15K]
MRRLFLQSELVSVLTSRPLDWPHLQRLAERWLRRWGFALTGLALGLSGMWLARPEVGEAHASAVQAVAGLTQRLAGMPSGAPTQKPAKGSAMPDNAMPAAQGLLRALPAWTPPEKVWTTWQQALVAQGLRLQYLQPMPPSTSDVRNGALVSHAAAWRVLGRFDDWVRVWSACAESGPVCAIERIQIVATEKPAEVQIDAVMRVWMRPAEKRAANVTDQVIQAHWMPDVRTSLQKSGRSHVALFALSHGTATAPADAAEASRVDGGKLATNAEGASAVAASLVVLPDDPHQWPFARVRLAGLWTQGGERQAVLSAGPHAVRVMPGQRVSLEGHRVVAITDAGVGLRLGKGPLLQLAWADALQVGATATPSEPVNTTTRQPP